ncbi:MAG: polysaccharide deacetylase family protein [Caldilineaceae bacterium]|nr:polysaccharide deacetylase family protein [Caldilineaceae bacterium]
MTGVEPGQTNRLLGYPPQARLLIINADDFGMCQAVNAAVMAAFRQGLLRSATLMTPCPWALHAIQFLQAHPHIAFGIHLTALSEWPNYRWGPLTPRASVPSLVDEDGYFYTFDRMPAFLQQVRLDELEREWRTQIERVLAAGLSPTHLDWHALRIDGRRDIHALMVNLALEYGLALRVRGRDWTARVQGLGLPVVDYDFLDSYLLDPADKFARYAQLLRALPPGLSEWAIHPGLDTPELRTIEGGRVRATDYEFLLSQAAQEIVEEEGIVLLDYRALQTKWRKNDK